MDTTSRLISIGLSLLACFTPCSLAGSSIAFVECDESAVGALRHAGSAMPVSDHKGAKGKLFRIDPANPTPFLVVDLSQDAFGEIRSPVFSPDGQWIAYSSEEDLMSTPWRSNLWITDRNGQTRLSVTHKTPGSFPPGSPTGSVEGTVYEDGYAKSGAWVYISSLEHSVTADTWGHYRFDNVPAGEQYVTAYDPVILYDDEDFGFMPVTVYAGATMQADVTLTWDWDLQQGVRDVAWTPSGQEVLFIDNAHGANRIRPDGGGLAVLVEKPEGIYGFEEVAASPANGRVLLIASVIWGDENLAGIWACDANGSNLRQLVSDANYGIHSLHWAPNGSLFGYSTLVQNQQGQYVQGVLFYGPDGAFAGGIALDEGWYAEFGGWDPTMQYACLAMYESGNWDQATLVTVRLSDYETTTLFGPTDIRFPSWGPEASSVDGVPGVSEDVVLGPAFPNPARDVVRLRIAGPEHGTVAVGVFDMMGRRVATISGEAVLSWDCRDERGESVPPGTYVFRPLHVRGSPRPVIIIR